MNFKEWFVESTVPTTMQANIPMPPEVRIISKVLKAYNPQAEVYAVGGAVRDYLFIVYHAPRKPYAPKDVDITTNLSEKEILAALRTPLAQQQDIRVAEKASSSEKDKDGNAKVLQTFGVVFVTVGESESMEIAPFRKDIGIADGRRPDSVERGTMHDDAMRRDFTINNLYYDFDKGVIIDLNPNAQGIKDIKDGPIIRAVGNPYDRFNEDKLRILRGMRLFSRFNPGDITQFLDKQTLEAIQHYQPLYNHGITPERIMDEFFAKGIPSAQDTAQFLQNYTKLGLFESVFPGMQVNTQDIPRIGNSKNAKVIYAVLLRGNGQVLNKLKTLKYPVWMFEGVQFLMDLMSFGFKSQDLVSLIKRKMRLQKMQPPAITDQDLQELMYMAKGLIGPEQIQRIEHLLGYQWEVPGGEELQRQGYQGAEIGTRQSELGLQHYNKSWDDFSKAKTPANPTNLDPQRTPPGTQS